MSDPSRKKRLRKRLWDLGIGGAGLDLMVGLAAVAATLGGLIGWAVDEPVTGAGIGGLIGLAVYAGLIIWAHKGRLTPLRRHNRD